MACAGLVAEMEVEAFVIDAPHAADADDQGILNPLIKRYQAGLCAQRIFSSPAVRVSVPLTLFTAIMTDPCHLS